jgi:hypothetical protein
MSKFDRTRIPTETGTGNTQIAQDLITDLVHCRSKRVSQVDILSSSVVSSQQSFQSKERCFEIMSNWKQRSSRYFAHTCRGPKQEISAH